MERRAFASAGKELTRLHVAAAAAEHNVTPQNIYTWLNGTEKSLSHERQLIVLKMFGLTSLGQLATGVTHAWVISGSPGTDKESPQAPMAELLLSRETLMRNLKINLAYMVTTSGTQLIGAEVCWEAPHANGTRTELRQFRLALTALANTWADDEFVAWLLAVFAPKSVTKFSKKDLGRIEVSSTSATIVWRYYLSSQRLVGGKRAMTPPRKSLLPFNQDLVDAQSAKESPVSVLEDMVPRFKELITESASNRGVRVGPRDLGLVRRANDVLNIVDVKK